MTTSTENTAAADVCGQPVTHRVAFRTMNSSNVHGECRDHALQHEDEGFVIEDMGSSFGYCLCPPFEAQKPTHREGDAR